MFTIRLPLLAVTCAGMLLAATGAPAHSDDSMNVLYAANDGVDGPTCGARSNPCRSINETIAHATDGALIIVGPGRYGDVNLDGDLTEELPDPACSCVFDINKRLTIISRAGAAQTILDMGRLGRDLNVRIASTGTVFGVELRGFTVMAIYNPFSPTVRVGIRIESSDRTLVAGNTVEMQGGPELGSVGIWVQDGTGHRIRGNISAHNSNGIVVNAGGNRISGNSFYDNALRGLYIDGRDNLIQFNVSVGNEHGMRLAGPGHLVFRNSFIGNRVDGISIEGSSNDLRLTRNNFFGNGTVATIFGESLLNCGINLGGPGEAIDARNNYWGSPQGPGPDPADAVCNSTAVLIQPVAKTEVRIPMLW
jgi:parallel beta-helix repeat protein